MLMRGAAAVAVILIGLTALAAAGRSRRSHAREVVRRRRRVTRDPRVATLGDVAQRIRAEIPEIELADFAAARIANRGMNGPMLWAWLDSHGARALVYALAAGHSPTRLGQILSGEEKYDEDEVALFARLAEPGLFPPSRG
jgi:hypothetical protein